MSTVELVANGAVGVLTIDNPPVNALSSDILRKLATLVDDVNDSSAIRSLVICTAGERVFAAGADIEELELLKAGSALAEHLAMTRRLFSTLATLRQPTIAATQGATLGGGLEIALACDFIYGEPSSTYGFPEVRIGLIPGAGGTQRLTRRLSVAQAMKMIVTGTRMSAPTALGAGLIDHVSQSRDELFGDALEFGKSLAELPGRAVQGAKRALAHIMESRIAGGLDMEEEIFTSLFHSDDFDIGVRAFLDRTKPLFTHR